MIAFIEENRDIGVEPICKHLPIAPSTFYDHMAKRANPDLLSDRAKRDKTLRPEIDRVWEQNYKVYGVRKVWHQMHREGFDVARCTVARLMNDMGLEGIIRGKKARTTIPDEALPCPLDKVNRQFRVPAPDMLWVSDFTCQRRSKNRPRGGAKPGQWRGAKRHGACAPQIAGACHGALARRANSAMCDQVAAWAFRARLWPRR